MVNCQPRIDGGWGWMVVVGAFISYFVADGIAYSFGVLFTELIDHFGKGKGQTAIIGALVYGIPLIISPFTCALCTCYGCRKVGIVGGLLCAVAFCASAFANTLTFLCFTIGIIASVGLSMAYLSTLLVVTYYFEDLRGRAIAFAVTGSGLGAFAFPPLTEWLVDTYTWRGAMFIIGGICLEIVVASALYYPPPIQPGDSKDIKETERQKSTTDVTVTNELKVLLKSMIRRDVFTNLCFVVFTGSTFLAYLWIGTPYVYLVDWANENKIPPTKGALLLSYIGIGRTVGQLITGFLGDHKKVNSLLLYSTGIFLCGTATALLPVSGSYSCLVCLCLLFGFGVSVTYSLQMICIIWLCGTKLSTSAFGIFQLGQGIATLLGTPLTGWLFDNTGSYTTAFVTAGITIAVSVVMLVPVIIKRSKPVVENDNLM